MNAPVDLDRVQYRLESIALIGDKQWGEIWYREDVPALMAEVLRLRADLLATTQDRLSEAT